MAIVTNVPGAKTGKYYGFKYSNRLPKIGDIIVVRDSDMIGNGATPNVVTAVTDVTNEINEREIANAQKYGRNDYKLVETAYRIETLSFPNEKKAKPNSFLAKIRNGKYSTNCWYASDAYKAVVLETTLNDYLAWRTARMAENPVWNANEKALRCGLYRQYRERFGVVTKEHENEIREIVRQTAKDRKAKTK